MALGGVLAIGDRRLPPAPEGRAAKRERKANLHRQHIMTEGKQS
jgi:hypothetical protein